MVTRRTSTSDLSLHSIKMRNLNTNIPTPFATITQTCSKTEITSNLHPKYPTCPTILPTTKIKNKTFLTSKMGLHPCMKACLNLLHLPNNQTLPSFRITFLEQTNFASKKNRLRQLPQPCEMHLAPLHSFLFALRSPAIETHFSNLQAKT